MPRVLNSLLPVLLLAGCSGGSDEGELANIVAVLPYTGTFEVKAQRHESAIRMALDDLVASGAHDQMNRKYNVIPVNSGDGKEVVKELMDDVMAQQGDSVLGIISSTGEAHEGSVPTALEYGIPHFETSSGAHDDEFLDWSEYSEEQLSYLMSSRALCNYEAIYTAEFIMDKWPTGTVVLLRGDLTHDKMHTGTIRTTLQNMGFAGVVIESNAADVANDTTYAGNDQDFLLSYEALEAGGVEAAIRTVVDTHQPDVIFWHLRGDAANMRFVQDAQRVAFDGGLVTCGMARTPEFIDPNENGLISDYLVGDGDGRFFFINRSPLPTPELDTFKSDFEEQQQIDADTFAPAVYDAAMLWGLGVLAADDYSGSTVLQSIVDVSQDGATVNRANLGTTIPDVANGDNVDYSGVSGSMDVRGDRTVPGSYFVERVVPDGSGYAYQELTSPARVEK